ncbi:MAG: NAD(P)-dependent glycerol-3-phosphate dehydrogenase [Limnohabitans sp.]|nr:NAD(P)-dependent glycerol-3-phosphate dehydrogenase [Limnohabitans sp.]
MRIAILGAGAWGTALALQACKRHEVTLWARNPEQVAQMQRLRSNTRYLPSFTFPDQLHLSHQPIGEWFSSMQLIVIAAPTSALRSMLQQVSSHVGTLPVVWLCKGFESSNQSATGISCMAHEVQQQVAPQMHVGALSGPSFAQEVAQGLPTALVAASVHASVRNALVDAFHAENLRIYTNDDLIGVEVGGAVKNVLAIATGLCDGLQLGMNARATLITRGLAEMTRLGVALGAQPETFMGLSGLGDLVLTATGDLSRNRQVGLRLAYGKSLAQVLKDLGHVAEGVSSAKTVFQRAEQLNIDMPITHSVFQLLEGQLSAVQAVALLMGRQSKLEK